MNPAADIWAKVLALMQNEVNHYIPGGDLEN